MLRECAWSRPSVAWSAGALKKEDTWCSTLCDFDHGSDTARRAFDGQWHGWRAVHTDSDGNPNVFYYADDFVFMHENKSIFMEVLPKVREFLEEKLMLTLHPDKTFIQTSASGVDFLGWVHFPDHRVLRTTTKRRMFKKLNDGSVKPKMLMSYLGLLRHGNTKKLQEKIKEAT